jgi:hypothetical protein
VSVLGILGDRMRDLLSIWHQNRPRILKSVHFSYGNGHRYSIIHAFTIQMLSKFMHFAELKIGWEDSLYSGSHLAICDFNFLSKDIFIVVDTYYEMLIDDRSRKNRIRPASHGLDRCNRAKNTFC